MKSLTTIETTAPNLNLVKETYGFIHTGSIVDTFARKGCELRLGHLKGIQDIDLYSALEPKRFADIGKDAFSIFNVLQERIIRGGIRYKQANEKTGFIERKYTRGVNSVGQSVKYNRELWNIMEEVVG